MNGISIESVSEFSCQIILLVKNSMSQSEAKMGFSVGNLRWKNHISLKFRSEVILHGSLKEDTSMHWHTNWSTNYEMNWYESQNIITTELYIARIRIGISTNGLHSQSYEWRETQSNGDYIRGVSLSICCHWLSCYGLKIVTAYLNSSAFEILNGTAHMRNINGMEQHKYVEISIDSE